MFAHAEAVSLAAYLSPALVVTAVGAGLTARSNHPARVMLSTAVGLIGFVWLRVERDATEIEPVTPSV